MGVLGVADRDADGVVVQNLDATAPSLPLYEDLRQPFSADASAMRCSVIVSVILRRGPQQGK